MRYLAPFRERVEPYARELQLDQAWIYGLMRQESRFVMNARSSAGASGLMQLMPGTAKYVAKRIGLKDFHPSLVNDLDTNVVLGTNYLRMVLEDLDNHPVLASAAYNAGPGRARKWRDWKPLEGAIYAETIPFNETRDYVKKVMSNAVYYAALFNGKPPSLKEWLGVVSPRGSDNGGNGDLP
jgi:soluble lytic murein transglycosylase